MRLDIFWGGWQKDLNEGRIQQSLEVEWRSRRAVGREANR